MQHVRYIRLAKETHPDTGGDAVIFQDVLLAYRILSDEERRKAFDDTGSDSGDATEEERKVRLPDLPTLRSAVENHRRGILPRYAGITHLEVLRFPARELKWERDMSSLAGQVGTVQFDDPEYGITAVA